MYRDDATALEEQGAALEEQLASLRTAGPPGAVSRIAEIEAARRRLRRFGRGYAWLVGVPALLLLGFAPIFCLVPAAMAVAHLWFELSRQRRTVARRLAQLAQGSRVTHEHAEGTSAPPVVPAAVELGDIVEHQEALARELAVYRASGTRDQALAVDLGHERDDLARHGRSYLWLAAAVLLMVMPPTHQEPLDPLPLTLGVLGVVLGSFALRVVTHGRTLGDRLAIARRDLARAERSPGWRSPSSLAASNAEATEALRQQREVVRAARHELTQTRNARDQDLVLLARSGAALFGCLVALVPFLTQGAAVFGRGGFLFASVVVVAALIAIVFGGKGAVALTRDSRKLRLAELEDDAAEEHLHRLRADSPGTSDTGVSPRVRVDVENVLEEEVPSSASYARERELP